MVPPIAASSIKPNLDGKVCAEAAATFTILGEAQAARAVGDDVSTLAPTYLR